MMAITLTFIIVTTINTTLLLLVIKLRRNTILRHLHPTQAVKKCVTLATYTFLSFRKERIACLFVHCWYSGSFRWFNYQNYTKSTVCDDQVNEIPKAEPPFVSREWVFTLTVFNFTILIITIVKLEFLTVSLSVFHYNFLT